MANMDSAEFTLLGSPGAGTLGVLAPYQRGVPKKVGLPFHVLIPTPSSAAPTLRLTVAPKGFKPVAVKFACQAQSASAGVGLSIEIGDAGDTDRLMAATDSDGVVSVVVNCPVAAYDYEYGADTAIIGTVTAAKTPVAGTKIWGEIEGYINT